MNHILLAAAALWTGLWFTPEQQGERLLERGEFKEAAERFQDPMRQGVAWYRAGEFQKAAQAFASRDTAEARYNQTNALLMHGDYVGAIAGYGRALEARPGWREAEENRALAEARAKAVAVDPGNSNEGMLGADKVVFDSKKKGADG